MRVLQIAPCYVDINKETGGVANIIREICLAADKMKIDTVLLCPNTELGKTVANVNTIRYSEYLTVHIIAQNTNPLLGPLKQIHEVLRDLKQVDIVHIHTCFSFITEYSMNYFCGSIPTVFTPHGKLSPQIMNNRWLLKKIIFNIITKRQLNKITEYICSSVNEIQYANDHGIKSKKSFIYNGYRRIEGQDDLSELEIEPKTYLLFLGYLDPRKQPELLISAFSRSRAKDKFKLVLAGPDSYGFRLRLEEIINENHLTLDKEVFLPGRVEGKKKWTLLNNAHALLLPSKAEGWPVTIAEAIGAEIPSVISNACNFNEIEEFNIGLLVKNFSEQSWSDAIDRICFDSDLIKIFHTNLSKYKNQFSWETITEQWITKYKQIGFSGN